MKAGNEIGSYRILVLKGLISLLFLLQWGLVARRETEYKTRLANAVVFFMPSCYTCRSPPLLSGSSLIFMLSPMVSGP